MEVTYKSRLVKHNKHSSVNEIQKGQKGEKGDYQLQPSSPIGELKITKLDGVQSIRLISEEDSDKYVTLKVDSKSNTLNVNDVPLGFIKVLGSFETEEQLILQTQNCLKGDAFTLPSSHNSFYRNLWIATKDNPSSQEDWVNLGKFTGPRGIKGEKGEKGDPGPGESVTFVTKVNELESNLSTQQNLLSQAISKIEHLETELNNLKHN